MVDRLRISRRTLVIFLLASVAAHALLLVLVPGWRVSVPVSAPEMPMLDVVMVAPQPPAAAPPPKTAAPAPAPRVASPPPRKPAPAIAREADAPPVVPAPEPASPVASAAAPTSVESSPSPAATAPASPAPPIAKAPPVITPPAFSATYLRNPPPAYPASARRNGEEGTVLLRVLVGRDGAPLKVEVDQSSRSRALDRAALDAVKDWRFVPARRGAETIEAWVRVPVSFRLES